MSGNGQGKQRRRFFVYKLLKDHALKDRLSSRLKLASKRSQDGCGASLARCLKHVRFCVVCSASLFKAMAPWAFAACEVAVMLLLYSLLIPNALPMRRHISHFRYHFRRSLEDVVAFSLLRFLAMVLAYAFGSGRSYHRPYMYTAYACAAIGIPFVGIKLLLFKLPHHWLPQVSLMVASLAFSVAHLLMAKNVMEWARQRYQMGLLGYGYPWEEGEEAWLLFGRSQTLPETANERQPEDVDPRTLADPDSRFIECQGLMVHYKEEAPAGGCCPETGVVLVHGFGGGAFVWRHVMRGLAHSCGCRVVAFDRPAFGLTSRPRPPRGQDAGPSPYSLSSQVELTLALTSALGLRRVVFVGHADGALLALLASALACRPSNSPEFDEPANSMDLAWMLGTPAGGELAAEHSSLSVLQVSPLKGSLHSPRRSRMLFHDSHSQPGTLSDVERTSASAPLLGADALGAKRRRGSVGSLSEEDVVSSGASADEAPSTTSLPAGERECSRRSMHHQDLPPGFTSPMTRDHHPRQQYRSYRPPHADLEAGTATPYLPTPFAEPSSEPRNCAAFPGQSWCRGGEAGPSSSAAPALHHHCRSASSAPSDGSGSCERDRPEVLGMALLHPSLNGEVGPSFMRLLGKSRLGRRMLRPLLRSELGELSNRRAWADMSKLTANVLALYKAPLHVENWDVALIEVSRVKREVSPERLASAYQAAAGLPALVVTGAQDRIVPPPKAALVAGELPHSRLQLLLGCGHLSHEEAPAALLDSLTVFVSSVLGARDALAG